jgi:hypothetical protein
MVDFKYGAGVKVYVDDNEQTQFYALGALEKFSMLADFKTIRMTIHQPRMDNVSSLAMSVRDLMRFAKKAEEAAVGVHEVFVLVAAGATPEELYEAGYLVPGEKQCMWCRAKATCPALRAEVAELTTGNAKAADFAHLIKTGPTTGDNYLSVAMDAVDRIEDWCRAIRAEVERRLLYGQPVPGYKLVEGKKGNRAWVDQSEAEKALKASPLKTTEIYTRALISPTTAEKLLQKPNPKAWEALQPQIRRADGKPSVAPATDPRPALAITPVAEALRAASKE